MAPWFSHTFMVRPGLKWCKLGSWKASPSHLSPALECLPRQGTPSTACAEQCAWQAAILTNAISQGSPFHWICPFTERRSRCSAGEDGSDINMDSCSDQFVAKVLLFSFIPFVCSCWCWTICFVSLVGWILFLFIMKLAGGPARM